MQSPPAVPPSTLRRFPQPLNISVPPASENISFPLAFLQLISAYFRLLQLILVYFSLLQLTLAYFSLLQLTLAYFSLIQLTLDYFNLLSLIFSFVFLELSFSIPLPLVLVSLQLAFLQLSCSFPSARFHSSYLQLAFLLLSFCFTFCQTVDMKYVNSELDKSQLGSRWDNFSQELQQFRCGHGFFGSFYHRSMTSRRLNPSMKRSQIGIRCSRTKKCSQTFEIDHFC